MLLRFCSQRVAISALLIALFSSVQGHCADVQANSVKINNPALEDAQAAKKRDGVARLVAETGVTAISGRVVTTDGVSLPNVVVQDEGITTTTDSNGLYLLSGIPVGTSVVTIDAGQAGDKEKADYGYYEVQVNATAGLTTVLSYNNWLPKIDHKNEVKIASPTKKEVVVKNPALPGLEFHLPKGAVLTGVDHKPVTKISITPIPVDRTPYPLPNNVPVPIYFTVQPGGAVISGADGKWVGAQIWYPNFDHQLPKAKAAFFRYAPYKNGWEIYGTGTVDSKRKFYIPDEGTRIYNLTSAMFNAGTAAPSNPPPNPSPCRNDTPQPKPTDKPVPSSSPDNPACGTNSGDPVDLASGLWMESDTDLSLEGIMPLNFNRTYMSSDVNVRSFGVGMTLNYDAYLWSQNQYAEVDLIMPNGSRVHYVRTSPGVGYADAVFTAQTNPGPYFNSTIAWNGTGWNLTRADGMVYVFPEYAPLAYMQDRYGNRISLTRATPAGNVTSISSSSGRSINLTYNASNVITQAKDNLGRTVSYTYDSSNRIKTVTDANGGITTYNWDATNNWITSVQRQRQNPSGPVQLTNTYDSNGRVHIQTLATGAVWTFNYTLSGSTVTETDVTDPNSNISKTTFNPNGYWLTQKLAYGTAIEEDYTAVLGGSTPPTGCTLNTPANSPTNYLIGYTDALSRVTCMTYDANGSVLTVTKLAGTANAVTTTYTYGAYEQLTGISDPLGHTIAIGRDSLGRPTSFTDGLSNVWPIVANADGTIQSITDPLTNQTSFTYNQGDLATVKDPLNRVTTVYPDTMGRTVRVTDPLNDLWQGAYDNLWGLSATRDANGNVSRWTYNADGGVASFIDPRSTSCLLISTSYAYDTSDRLTARTDPLFHTATINTYNGVNQPLTATDRNGNGITYTYDQLNRIASATYHDGHVVNYTWDAGNRLHFITDTVSSVANTITRGYDGLDRLTSEVTQQGSTTLGTTTYTYDNASRPATMQLTGQTQLVYTFDNANRLTKIVQGSNTVNIGYDTASRRNSLTLPNGIVATYTLDAASELTGLSYDKSGTNIGTLSYGYDTAGRVISRGGTLFKSILPASAVSVTSYNNGNQLILWGTTSPTYDNNGNMTSDGTHTYVWDSRNRLTSITGVASYVYDGANRRQSITQGSTTITTVYDRYNPIQEQSPGTTVLANLLTGLGMDERFTRTESTTTTDYLTDMLNSTVALTNTAGTPAITTSYGYDAYGVTTATGTASDNGYQYTGRTNDGATNLYYNRARYYNPTWGRFISEDPIGLNAGPNIYAYVGGNPVYWIDPMGLDNLFGVPPAINVLIHAAPTGGSNYLMENPFLLNQEPFDFLVDAAPVYFEFTTLILPLALPAAGSATVDVITNALSPSAAGFLACAADGGNLENLGNGLTAYQGWNFLKKYGGNGNNMTPIPPP